MEIKKSVVKKANFALDKRTNQPSKTSLIVEFENGDWGYYKVLKGINPFLVGNEITYGVDAPEGKKYKIITIPQAGAEPKTPTIPPDEREWEASKTYTDMKFEARMHLVELASRLIVAGRIEPEELESYFTNWVEMMDGSIKKLRGE